MINNNIKSILRKERRTNKYITDRIDISESHLSNIINGKITPRIDLALKIAKALNTPVEQVFYLQEEKKPN